jgi:hypothetical protein
VSAELGDWLRKHILERKAIAEQASTSPWLAEPNDHGIGPVEEWLITGPSPMRSGDIVGPGYEGGGAWEERDAHHIALNDPRDTIARCDAELAILDEHQAYPATYPGEYDFGCPRCSPHAGDGIVDPPGWCPTVKHLASGYQFRPGYQEAWKS